MHYTLKLTVSETLVAKNKRYKPSLIFIYHYHLFLDNTDIFFVFSIVIVSRTILHLTSPKYL